LNDSIFKGALAGHSLEAIYLDTTYCDPQYAFPAQSTAIEACCDYVSRLINKHDQRGFAPIKRLVLVGSYLIGKERIAVALAKTLGSKIYCLARKRLVFSCLEWPELQALLTEDPTEAAIHICPMSDLDGESVGVVLDQFWPRFTHALAIRPTGWAFKPKHSASENKLAFSVSMHPHQKKSGNDIVKRKDAIMVMGLPYSEHSSFSELCSFLSMDWLEYQWIIPTVSNDNRDLYLEKADAKALLSFWNGSS